MMTWATLETCERVEEGCSRPVRRGLCRAVCDAHVSQRDVCLFHMYLLVHSLKKAAAERSSAAASSLMMCFSTGQSVLSST